MIIRGKQFRVVFCFALTVIMLFSGLNVFAAENDEELQVQHMGDIDGNGTVDIDDVRIIMAIAANLIENDYTNSDVDGNGVVDLRDARTALQISLGILKPLDKTGDNLISEDPDNEYIALIASTYKVDTASLVAIYAVPDKGNNFVLQFNKKGLFGKEYGRSPSDLSKVYQIGLDKSISIATATGIGATVSIAESILVFELVKGVIMPQHPDVFTDV